MKKQKYLILLLGMVLTFTNSCDILEPEDNNTYELDDVLGVMTFAEGFLINAYRNIPASHQTFTTDYGSDDAVNNDANSNIKTVVDGGWTSAVNPFSTWNTAYESIFYLNTFFNSIDQVVWDPRDQDNNKAFADKLRGEAFALRAWNYFNLLQAHAGLGTNGEMLGVPIVREVLELDASEYSVPRSSFNELVAFILEDCEEALLLLPSRWEGTDIAVGERNTNRINGLVAQLIKTKTLLYAASPAYSDGTYTYEMAAQAAADFMDANNGLTGFSGTKTKFYNEIIVTAFKNRHKEVIWYSARATNQNSWEDTNYAPSVFGEGLTNPSQNLIDAFPMEDGNPVTTAKINSNDPYTDRDPRLDLFIMYNGSAYKGGTLNTTQGSRDALGSQDPNATITGYYLKKFLNTTIVNVDPDINSGGTRYFTYARYTDVLLMYAEAANEVGGPDANIGGYTAREIVNAIRTRAKITATTYVDGLNKEQMAALIRNERRLEMCFEKQRFWDLRRWNMVSEMNVPIKGVEVSVDGTLNYVEVENRNYGSHQIYGPIPFSETLKYDMVQNQGW
tara:strand:+ start:3826 stop:5511 length:1686 start_codon:yes stop_codon:yes gene_type:complete